MRFKQTESVLQTKNRSEPAKNRFSVALIRAHNFYQNNWKRNLFSQNWSDNDVKKKRPHNFYNIFYLHV